MKLVRDKIPELHASGQLTPRADVDRDRQTFRRATPDEYRLLLRLKLAEEVGEVLSATNHGQLMVEIGDVIDVLQALQDHEGRTAHDSALRLIKLERFGGFTEGWVLEEKSAPPPPFVERPEPKIGDSVCGRTFQCTIAGFDEDRGTRLSTGAWICASQLEYLATGVWKVKDKDKEEA